MKRQNRFLRLLAVLCAALMVVTGTAPAAFAELAFDHAKLNSGTVLVSKTDQIIAPGVTISNFVTNNAEGSNQITTYAVEVDLNNKTTGILASYKDYMNGLGDKDWGMQSVLDQANAAQKYYQKTDPNFQIVAGTNGDFFNMGNGAPTGSFVMAGHKYNTNSGWPYFAILKDGTPVIRKGGSDLSDVRECVGGPCIIMQGGEESYWPESGVGYGVTQEPRTAVGIKADGSVVITVSDGRQKPYSAGQNFKEMVEQMKALGCVDAICLDGGGSSTFISRDPGDALQLRNIPSDGMDRTVSTALLIYSTAVSDGSFDYATVQAAKPSLIAGDTTRLTVTGFDASCKAVALPANGELALVETDMGELIDGFFVSNGKAGAAHAEYRVDGVVKGKCELQVVDPAAAGLKSRWYTAGGYVFYLGADGKPVTGTQTIGGSSYTFNDMGALDRFAVVKSDGTLLKNAWYGSQYYLGADGLPVTGQQTLKSTNLWEHSYNDNGVRKTEYVTYSNTKTYTFDDNGVLIRGALEKYNKGAYTHYSQHFPGGNPKGYHNRYLIAGVAQRNWYNIDGSWYYFDRLHGNEKDGFPAATNVSKEGKYYLLRNSDGSLEYSYEFDKDGKLVKGSWITLSGGKAYAIGNNQRASGWAYLDGGYYYFDPGDTFMVTGAKIIDGKEYTFAANGRLTSGKAPANNWLQLPGGKTYVTSSGAYARGWKVIDGEVYYFGENNLMATTHQTIDGSFYLFGADGKLVSGSKSVTADGKVVSFLPDGKVWKEHLTDHAFQAASGDRLATCSQYGVTGRVICSVCGMICTDGRISPVDPTNHANTTLMNEVPVTCVTDGFSGDTYCDDCGKKLSSGAVVPATGHSPETVPAVAPTCTEAGLTAGERCSVCGEILTAPKTVPPAGHTPETLPGKAATCTEPGLTAGSVCSVCGEILTAQKTIPPVPHTPQTVPGKAATCTEAGMTDSEICSVCGEILTAPKTIPQIPHTPETVPGKAATCVDDGLTDGEKCAVCGETLKAQETIPALGHAWSEWTVVKEPTVEETGKRERVCARCSETESETISKLPDPTHVHNWDDGVVTTQPTCTQEGVLTISCDGCDETMTQTIPALGHDWGDFAPTDENTHSRVCKRDASHIETQAHTLTETVVTQATCASAGQKKIDCAVCGYTATVELPKTAHQEIVIPGTPATCTTDGAGESTVCTVCGETLSPGEVIWALGHQWDDGVVTKAATCAEPGVLTRTCARCGETQTEALAMLEHQPVPMTDVPATCTAPGSAGGVVCAVCGKTLIAPTQTPATAHTYIGAWIATDPVVGGANAAVINRCAVCGQTHESTADQVSLILGDLNGDKRITAGDARTALRVSARLEPLTQEILLTADADYSGDVIARDARTILRVSARLETFNLPEAVDA